MLRAAAMSLTVVALGAPALAQPGEIIIVRDQAAVAGCTWVSEVRSRSWWGGMVTNYAYGQALTGMKKQASTKGATHVLLIDSSSGQAGTNMLGQAYRCAAPSPPAADPAPQPQP